MERFWNLENDGSDNRRLRNGVTSEAVLEGKMVLGKKIAYHTNNDASAKDEGNTRTK